MIIGTGILLVTYLIIVSLLLLLIFAPKLNFWIKCLTIPVVIWFGAALYFIPPTLSGHPTSQEWKDGSILINFIIKENEKCIYLLMIPPLEKDPPFYKMIYPQNMFRGKVVSTHPRLYVIEYSKGDHKKLKNAEESAGKKNRIIRLFRNKQKQEKQGKSKGEGEGKQSKEKNSKANDEIKKSKKGKWEDPDDPGGEIGEWISEDPLPEKKDD